MTTLFSGGYRNVNNVMGGVRVNTSLQGIPITIVGGRNIVAPNLLWYGNFSSQPIAGGKKGAGGGSSGKKGGGQYDYGAAVIMALCQGPITRVGNIWANTGYLPVNLTQEAYVIGGDFQYVTEQVNTFLQDMGVQEETPYSIASNNFGSPYGAITLVGNQETPMTPVNTNPPTISGTYYESGGTYVFAVADLGVSVTINYTYAPPITEGGVAEDPITTVGFTIFTGEQSQDVWSFMTSNHPSQALGYSTIAYAASPQLDLGAAAALPNYNFEIYGLFPFGNGNWECDPSVFVSNMLTNPLWGCGFESGEIGSTSAWSNYCVANGLFMSPICDQQRTASDYIKDFLDASNTEMVESGGVLNFIPRGDTTVVGNGQTFTPQTNPVYSFTDDDLLRDGSAPPVKVKRPTIQDAYNSIKIEFVDVNNNYNSSIVEAQDLGAIQLYKYRPEGQRSYHFFTSQTPAALAAQTILSNLIYIRNTYTFKTSMRFFLLDPMDIVQIPNNLIYGTSDTSLVAVRLTAVTENADNTLSFEAEDFPWGCSGPTLYPKQVSSPSVPNAYAAPGSINTPIIFEAASRLNSQIGHNIWFGLSGANINWGGCRIWVSLDGTNYKQIGTAVNPTIMGLVTADFPSHSDPDTSDTLAVNLTESSGVLQSGTVADADLNALLCFVSSPAVAAGGPYILQDSGSHLWQLSMLPEGVLEATSVASGTVTPITLSDPSGVASWQLGVTTTGLLTLTSVSYSSSYPKLLGFTGSYYVLGVTLTGVFQTFPTAPSGEMVSYETATLVGSYQYNIAPYIRRGVYNSTITDHPIGSNFMVLNDFVEGWTYDPKLIGETVHFKFTSFNQSGNVEESVANVPAYPFTILGTSIGLITPANVSYTITSNPLTAIDAGASATINVAAFQVSFAGLSLVSYNAGSVIGLSYNTIYYVYVDDPDFSGDISGTSHPDQATTDKASVLSFPGYIYIGSITTPRAGGVETFGNGDGGAGAQMGVTTKLSMSEVVLNGSMTGVSAVNNGFQMVDNDGTTYGSLTAGAGASGGTVSVAIQGPAGVTQRFFQLTLYIRRAVPINGTPSNPLDGAYQLGYSTTGPTSPGGLNIIESFVQGSGTTLPLEVLAIALDPTVNPSQVAVIVTTDTLSGGTGTPVLEADIYEVWMEGLQ